MENKKRVICTNDLTEGLTKDKVYEVEQIHYGQTVYYDVIDDNGVKSTHNANDFVDTKQVVINCEESYKGLLNPYWIVELFKRKGEVLYGYCWNAEPYDSYYYLIDVKNYNNFKDMNYILYSYKKIEGKIYDDSDFDDLIDSYDIFDGLSREDKDLIDIAKEINDESIIKIVDIPADIDYYIQSGECSFAETVVEKHRRWS